MKENVHFFYDTKEISVRGAAVSVRWRRHIACGSRKGEADNRRKLVTCEKCRAKLGRTPTEEKRRDA